MDDMMTIEDAAAVLGITVDTLRTWVRTGRIERSLFTKRHGRLIPRSEVERCLEERKVATKRGVTAWAPLLPRKESPIYSPLRKIGSRS